MPATSRLEFLDLLERGNLPTLEQMREIRETSEEEPRAIVLDLVQRGWLTRWQGQQLMSGRSDFFLGRYKLVDLLGQGGRVPSDPAWNRAGVPRTACCPCSGHPDVATELDVAAC
jgi:hypothetical protein